MRHAGKICGVFTAGLLGALIFMAPDTFPGDALFADLTTSTARADKAQPSPVLARERAKIKAANDAYVDAARALAVGGENGDSLARLEAADDAYFEAQMALEEGDETSDMLAQPDAADDAYLKAAMVLEGNIETRRQLAEPKASEEADFETVIAQIEAVDPSVTGSLPPASGMDDLEDRITTATLSMQTENELVMEEPSAEFLAQELDMQELVMEEPGAEFLAQESDRQELVMEEPGKEFLSQEQVRVASSSQVDTVASIPAKEAQGMPAAKTRAVAKQQKAKPTRSARLEARVVGKKKPVGPIRRLFRMFAKGNRPNPQQ